MEDEGQWVHRVRDGIDAAGNQFLSAISESWGVGYARRYYIERNSSGNTIVMFGIELYQRINMFTP